VAEEPAVAEVAGEGAVGEAGVDDDDACAGAAGFAEEVGPDFGLHDNEERGAEAAEDAADGEAVIERSIKDGVGEAQEFFFAEGAAGEGGGGDEDGDAGQERAEVAEQDGGGECFSDADGVQPYGAGGRRENVRRQEAEALAEAAEVAAVPGDAQAQVE